MGILNQLAYCNIWTVIFFRLSSPFFFPSRHVRFALNILKMCCLLYISHEFGLDMRFFFITFLTFHSFSSRFSSGLGGHHCFLAVWIKKMIFNWLSATRVGKLFPDGWKHPETLCQNSRHHYGSIFCKAHGIS